MFGLNRQSAERVVSVLIESLFLTLIFFTPLILTPFTQELFEWPKMMLVYFFTILLLFLWGTKVFLSEKIIFPKTPYLKYLLPFLILYALATVFSINFFTSFWGYYSRFNGGLLSLLAYLFLLYLFLTELRTRQQLIRFLTVLLFSSLLVTVYGILQRLGIDKDFWVQHSWERVFSTLGQPNWLAAFLGTLIPLNLGLLLARIKKAWETRRKHLNNHGTNICLFGCVWLLLLLAANIAAFYFTRSRSGYLALAGSFFLGATILAFKQAIKIRLLSLALLTGSTIAAVAIIKPNLFDLESETTRIRTIVWQGTLNLIAHHPFCGTGPETFAYAFLPYRPTELNETTEWDFVFNKPHNEYLGVAAGSGIPSLLLYLGFIGSVTSLSLKHLVRKPLSETWFLVWGSWLGLVSLWVSNFFGFSVVANQLLFFLFPGLIFLSTSDPDKSLASLRLHTRFRTILVLTASSLTLILMIFWVRFWRAEILYSRGGGELGSDPKNSQDRLEEATRLNPWQPRYRMGLAYAYSLRVEEADENDQREFLNLAQGQASQAYRQNPDDYILRSGLIKVYVSLSLTDEMYFSQALSLAKINVEKSPANPYDHYYLADLYQSNGQKDLAVKELELALKYRPDYVEAKNLLESLAPPSY